LDVLNRAEAAREAVLAATLLSQVLERIQADA